jgi:DNA polymerase III delta prime subunit
MDGVSSIERDFKSLIKNEALGHGYIFYGGSLAEELETAKSLANYLENGNWKIENKILLDALVVDGTQVDLGVDVARSFSDFLYRQPAVSSRRTLIVHCAGEFTSQAQSALLKISEEPPASALIILTVGDINVLQSPLLSRFAKIVFPRATDEAILTPAEIKAKDFLKQFLVSSEAGRSEIIKKMIVEERDIEAKGDLVVDHFTKYLIIELAKKPEENWRALKHLLNRFTLMNDYSTNKRLQLDSVLQFLK